MSRDIRAGALGHRCGYSGRISSGHVSVRRRWRSWKPFSACGQHMISRPVTSWHHMRPHGQYDGPASSSGTTTTALLNIRPVVAEAGHREGAGPSSTWRHHISAWSRPVISCLIWHYTWPHGQIDGLASASGTTTTALLNIRPVAGFNGAQGGRICHFRARTSTLAVGRKTRGYTTFPAPAGPLWPRGGS